MQGDEKERGQGQAVDIRHVGCYATAIKTASKHIAYDIVMSCICAKGNKTK